ncbi:hypothetical protein GCM10010329_62140 [Streptomyces spiroverticillatus]|uniref:HTH cro/C1-type domain-containing protein n=1 Tax=Streptomyces finlayi TaxID=67296 RepID=A0A918X619_9ACTN|nr:helix-turn-helix transcriptional regulator [Streptomyces finlayi]GHA30442.1 hypothetical protein GCM10010329_62140 [Streptomyces spiroverticillatus]GHD14828.1 hypothetical protein GCM10010334_74290 [Streptomyces finlayi]
MKFLTLPQQTSAQHDRTDSPGPGRTRFPGPALPSPAVRRLLREEWGLTRHQVAEAFGVTAATVRSWETGRTSPVGRRRIAYLRFLAGLAEAQAVREAARRPVLQRRATPGGAGKCAGPTERSAGAAASAPAERHPRTHSEGFPRTEGSPRAAWFPAVTGPLPVSAVRPLPVRPASDPVTPPRRRRMRNALVAAGVWCTLLHHLLATALPPH